MKPSQRYRIFWISAVVMAMVALAYLIVPPLILLNRFRSDFESAMSNIAGAPVTIGGDIRLSLLGYPMLAARYVRFNGMEIESVRFRISWGSIFNLKNAEIISGVKVHGMRASIGALSIPKFGRKIIISDSIISYAGKDYDIIAGALDNGRLSARVRTNQHKYNLEFQDGRFLITNPNERLTILGKMLTDDKGVVSASGNLSVEPDDLNEWFDFQYPTVKGTTMLTMDFDWDGKGYLGFSKIFGTAGGATFTGHVKLWHAGGKQVKKFIRMQIDNADMDLSFIEGNPSFLHNSEFDIVANGNIRTSVPEIKNIRNLSVKMTSKNDSEMDFHSFKADGDAMSITMAGKISGGRANNLDIAFYQRSPEQSVRCLISGNRENWKCDRWSVAGKEMAAFGTLAVTPDKFQMTFNSDNYKPDAGSLDALKKYVGVKDGSVDFKIGKMAGRAEISSGKKRVDYTEKDVMLGSLPVDLPLPKSMTGINGNIAANIKNDKMYFVFKTPEWQFSVDEDDGFGISHKSARKLLSLLTEKPELPFIRPDVPVMLAGKYHRSIISDLNIIIGESADGTATMIAGMKNNESISLKTEYLNLDALLDQKWFGNFIDNQYLSADPLLAPFGFGANVAITADVIKVNGAAYKGFVYSLDSAGQQMSISDSENGGMLLSISKNRSAYKYLVQMNKFFVAGKAFGGIAPVDIEGTTVTAEAEIDTFGLTAYDIRRNMTGMIDASFDGGILTGLGTDKFYDNVNSYGRLDTENALRAALDGGRTEIKEMQISGEYNGGDFRTVKPFLLAARHTDVTGNLSIKSGVPAIRANIVLRGTSPIPKPVTLTVNSDGRDYSLSEIMANIDLDYLREFVRTHKKF